MKIETLNIWGGQIHQPLIEHIKKQGQEVDIFCFQEVLDGNKGNRPIFANAISDIFAQFSDILPNHQGYFAPSQNNEEGLALFSHRTTPLIKVDDLFVYRWRDAMQDNDARTLGRNMQYVQFLYNGKQVTVANLHGLWNGQGKTDTPDRTGQSRKAKTFLNNQKGVKILCGDFNLLPNTQSLAILEEGMRNLVKEYNITSTRSSYYEKPDKFADYILVSPEITVVDFSVLQDQISDHLPLVLEFNI